MSAREFAPSGAAPSPDEIAESSKRADRFAGASGGIDGFFSAVKRFALRKASATILAERGATKANADTNAAINILRRADGALKPVEEHRSKRPDEAGTIRRAA